MHQSHELAPRSTLAERLAAGKSLRQQTPRSSHSQTPDTSARLDPIEILERSSAPRLPELVPIRHGRMMRSPLMFLRGSAAAMAADLAKTPSTGIHNQLCGDCHLANFGAFGTPERNLVFDVNDFDETLPGPWEWDIKRLAASVHVAGRVLNLGERDCRDAVTATVRSYRKRMREFAEMRWLDLWYIHIDATVVLDLAKNSQKRPGRLTEQQKAAQRVPAQMLPRKTEVVDGQRRILDNPPLVYHPPRDGNFEHQLHKFFHGYRESLQSDRKHLLSKYSIVDVAMKVVGVGAVGTRCAVMLLMAGDDDPIFLQYKEAAESVLAPYAGQSVYANQGQRVVAGQRLMQATSDILLGWSADDGRHFYFRQLRDMKAVVTIEGLSAEALIDYGEMCGWALARAHAKAGDPALIAGYLGKSDAFDDALADFAAAYADLTEQDHQAMLAAIHSGRLTALEEQVK